MHEFGLSSLASSESHIRHQLAAVRARLGDEASHPKERFSLPEARALLQQRTQALFGTLVPGAPHLMVTFERAFLDDADIVERAVACQEVGIVGQLRAGDRVLFDDGLIEGVVMRTGVERASLRVSRVSVRKPRLRGEKGMNFPDTALEGPGGNPHIILKIETREAVRDLPAILLEAMHQPLFGVMIARGDHRCLVRGARGVADITRRSDTGCVR